MSGSLGRIAEVWRYPVKSMQGERVESAAADERGIAGDRGYAIVAEDGVTVASAKHLKSWPGLIDCSARYVEEPEPGRPLPPVEIDLAGGRTVRSDDRSIDKTLSAFFGRVVELRSQAPAGATYEAYWPDIEGLAPDERRGVLRDEAIAMAAPEGTFFDLATLHVMTSTTLGRLSELHPEGRFDVRRFRPNLVVSVDGDARFAEDEWAGRTLRAGTLPFLVFFPTPRCVMTTVKQPGLEADPRVLRTVAGANRHDFEGFGRYACAGVYAGVTAPGQVAVGDVLAADETP